MVRAVARHASEAHAPEARERQPPARGEPKENSTGGSVDTAWQHAGAQQPRGHEVEQNQPRSAKDMWQRFPDSKQDRYMPTHKDVFNDKDSRNLVSPLKVTEGAGVWEELKPGDTFTGRYKEMDIKGVATPGQIHSLRAPVTVNPKRWHCAVQGSEGPRLLLVGHTIGSWRKLKPHMVSQLEESGFALPDAEDPEALLRGPDLAQHIRRQQT